MIPQYTGDSAQFFTDCAEYLSLVSEINAPDSQIVRVLQNIVTMRDENAIELNAEGLQSIVHIEPPAPEVVEYPNTLLGRTIVAAIETKTRFLQFRDWVASFVASE